MQYFAEIYCFQKIQFRRKAMYGAKVFDYELWGTYILLEN